MLYNPYMGLQVVSLGSSGLHPFLDIANAIEGKQIFSTEKYGGVTAKSVIFFQTVETETGASILFVAPFFQQPIVTEF